LDYSQERSILRALGFFSLILILPFPTGFYYLSRLIVFIGAIYAFTQYKNLKSNTDEPIYYLLIAVAFIYNPIIMVFLYQKAIWIVVNICTALIFFNAASKFSEVTLTKSSRNHQTKATRNYQRNLSKKAQPKNKKDNSKNKQKNFEYDVLFFHTRIVKDQILHFLPRVIDKKEQVVLGVIYLFFLIDRLVDEYGFNVKLDKISPVKDTWFQPKAGNGFFINNLTVSVGSGPFFVHEVEMISIEKCLSSDKPNWLEEVKRRVGTETSARYIWENFQKSEFENIGDYVTSLRDPYWGVENPFFMICQDKDLMRSAKQDLSQIVETAESRLKSIEPSPEDIAIGVALGFTEVDESQHDLIDGKPVNQKRGDSFSNVNENDNLKIFSDMDIPGTEDFEQKIIELREKELGKKSEKN